ncbi:MAG TPA: MFS transporter [Thermomicrobiaceae bacterium]|nr:MFS transporter [Thermomicrobiaceae bacterium]
METHDHAQHAYARRWWTLAVLCLGVLVIGLDNTILNVALPTLVRDLHATESQLQWMVDAYILAFAGLLLTAGSVGDRYGRKKALIGGLVVFGLFSLLSSQARSADQLILTRTVMGIGGAFLLPTTLSIITNIFPDEERGRAIGIWSAIFGVSVPLGPIIGGWLLEHYAWGSVFLVNVPVVIVAVIALIALVPESYDPTAQPLDPLGAVLSISGLGSLLYAIIEAPSNGWHSQTTLIWFAVAAVLLAAFILWERHTRYPMLRMSLFKNARFSAASLSVTVVFFGLNGAMFFLTQYLQFVLGYSTLKAGASMIPVAFAIGISAPTSARLNERFGAKAVVTLGMLIVAGGMAILTSVSTTSGYPVIAAMLFVGGVGMGLAMTPATDSIMGAVPKEHAGSGSAVNDTTRQIGGALGVAILGSYLSTTYASTMSAHVAGLPPALAGTVKNSIGAALAVAQQVGGAPGAALAASARSAFVQGMSDTALIAMITAFVGALIALLFLPSRSGGRRAGAGAGVESEELVGVNDD